MTQVSRFWDGSTIGDATVAPYDAATEFSKVLMSLSGAAGITTNLSAVFRGELNELAVTGAATPVSVNTGRAITWGAWYENDAAATVAIPTPSASTRIDRIVLRKDWSLQTVRITRIAGVEGGAAPALVQIAGTTWDEPLAQVSITTGGAITLTDQRAFIGGGGLPTPSGTNSILVSTGGVASWDTTPAIGGTVSITLPSAMDTLVATSTDAGALGIRFTLTHDSPSPAVADALFRMDVWGRDSINTSLIYGRIILQIDDPLTGTTDSSWYFQNVVNNVITTTLQLSPTFALFSSNLQAYGNLTLLTGTVGIGITPLAYVGIYIAGATLVGNTGMYGILARPTFPIGATTVGAAMYAQLVTVNGALVMVNGYGMQIDSVNRGAASVITNLYGLRIEPQVNTNGTTNTGLYVGTPSGAITSNIAVRIAGGTPALQIDAGGATIVGNSSVTGVLTVTTNVATGFIQLGVNPSTTGWINLPNAAGIYARNQANSADIRIAIVDASNQVQLGPSGAGIIIGAAGLVTIAGSLTFSTTGQRITGDMSTTTLANRLAFQSSVVDGYTVVGVLPNGTATLSQIRFHNTSNPAAAGLFIAGISGATASLTTSANGGTEPTAINIASALGTLISINTATGEATFSYPLNLGGLKIGTPNQLINPGFEIWQRGAGAFTSSTVWTADRWQMAIATGTLSVVRNTADVDTGSLYCVAATTTGTVDSYVRQIIEDYIGLRGRTLTLVMRVKASVATAVRLFMWDSVNTYRYSSYHTGGSAYETLTLTLAIPAATTALHVGIRFSAVSTFYFDNATLVVGSVAADYTPFTSADDFAKSTRYYEDIGGDLTASYPLFGAVSNTTNQRFFHMVPFAVRKAVTPTVTKVGTWSVSNSGQPAVQSFDKTGVCLAITAVAAGEFFAQGNAVGHITVEANP